MERKPAVAGAFYPADPIKLKQMVERLIAQADTGKSADQAVSYVAPHAGYIYSGSVAACTYSALKQRGDLASVDTFVIIGPNHTGYGYPISISRVNWSTPIGTATSDIELVDAVVECSGEITVDETAHMAEHSIEVQLPFLQSIVEKPRCLFICMGDQAYRSATMLESAISSAADKLKRGIVVIASSDFNHYESAEIAKGKDMPAIKALERLQPKEFHDLIEKNDDSACGYGPITVAALYAKRHGAKEGRLLKYANSGDVTKDYGSVVAYLSMTFL